MRENRTYGSEGGEAKAFPTPITTLAQLHPLGGIGEANALKSLGRESKGRHYRG